MAPATKILHDETRESFADVNSFVGFGEMSKTELMEHANDPFWVRTRWSLFAAFWLCWFAMLTSAAVIIVQAPRCRPPPVLDWWQTSAVYQIFPLSFQDSNADGFGDLKGIESRVGYLSDLGVRAVWLNPIYKSPMRRSGYDVADHVEIEPLYGSFWNFVDLVEKLNSKGIELVLDFVPNHTSNASVWFERSRRRVEPYTNYYVWHDGTRDRVGNRRPPNNWLSVRGGSGSAWSFDRVRGQYYLHQFHADQPDLNLRSEKVRRELRDVLTFWLDAGVRGFRVDAASYLYEDASYENETANDHDRTMNLPENARLVAEWRSHLDDYTANNDDAGHIFLAVDATEDATRMYYGNEAEKLADFPPNFQLIDNLDENTNASDVLRLARGWLDAAPDGAWPNWALGSHDRRRVADRVDARLVDGLHMITTMLPGTSVTYYGEEIGMRGVGDADASFSQCSPMQWTPDGPNAGFTDANEKPWFPMNPNYKTGINVQTELRSRCWSHVRVYTKLLKLRVETAARFGSVGFLRVVDDVFGFARVKRGSPGLLVLVNFGANSTRVDLSAQPRMNPIEYVGRRVMSVDEYAFPRVGTVELDSGSDCFPAKGRVGLSSLKLDAKRAMLIKFVPDFSSE